MLHAVIMAGGAGTRFWPASRKKTPKQLLNLTGEKSMIEATVHRLGELCPPDRTLIVTNEVLVEPIRKLLPELPEASLIGEPAKRDTAPCVGLAASILLHHDPEATMVVMPADHVIGPDDVFQSALQHAVDLVEESPERIVTFGIKPTYPAEVFGYIERKGIVTETPFGTYDVERFREKPDAATAKEFLDSGNFYWNSGIFVWKASTIMDALKANEPEMHGHLAKIGEAVGSDRFQATLESEFSAIQGKSIDYAVMENYPSVQVVEAPYDWDDLGNWAALPKLLGVDQTGNTISGKHLGLETSNTIVRTDDDHLVVTVGVDDHIVVHTDDATLIVNRKHENLVGDVVKKLQALDWKDYL